MHEIVTLASIIQWEAVYDDEMKLISSVYHNRLDKEMLLQADPTVQYILPERKKKLLNKHYEIIKTIPIYNIHNCGYKCISSRCNIRNVK